jgi:hypothetical protein
LTAPAVRHRAALVEPRAFGALLRAIATYDGAIRDEVGACRKMLLDAWNCCGRAKLPII